MGADFVRGTGYTKKIIKEEMRDLAQFTFSVDEGMACTLYRSCRGVSLIAQASLQSSKSFLNFMGVNGQNNSLSIITFQFEPLKGKNESRVAKYLASKCDSGERPDFNELLPSTQ